MCCIINLSNNLFHVGSLSSGPPKNMGKLNLNQVFKMFLSTKSNEYIVFWIKSILSRQYWVKWQIMLPMLQTFYWLQMLYDQDLFPKKPPVIHPTFHKGLMDDVTPAPGVENLIQYVQARINCRLKFSELGIMTTVVTTVQDITVCFGDNTLVTA